MNLAVWTYPQDLVDEGTDEALGAIAALGIDEVRLAVSYHRAEVVTPRSRNRRLLRTPDGVHFRPDASRYGQLGPALATRDAPAAPPLLRRTRAVGLRPTAWVVLANNTRLGEARPDVVARNAWGDLLSFSLCVGHPTVRGYAVALVGDVADHLDVDEVVLEAWHHRRLADSMARQLSVLPPGDPGVRRAAWCFCEGCSGRLDAGGLDPERVAAQVRRGRVDPALEQDVEHVRRATVTSLVGELVDAAGAVPVRLFVPHDLRAAGIDLAAVSALVDGVSIACYADTAEAVGRAAADAAAQVAEGTSLEIALRPRDPFGAEPLAALVAAVDRAAPSARLSLYQYGQMTAAALDAIAALPGRST